MTLTEMLNEKAGHIESMDKGAIVWVEDAKSIFKEWLRTVGLPHYHSFDKDGNALNATECIQQLLITLVDEP